MSFKKSDENKLKCPFCGEWHEYVIGLDKIAFMCHKIERIVHWNCLSISEVIVSVQEKKHGPMHKRIGGDNGDGKVQLGKFFKYLRLFL